jgi:hypothetical protein
MLKLMEYRKQVNSQTWSFLKGDKKGDKLKRSLQLKTVSI